MASGKRSDSSGRHSQITSACDEAEEALKLFLQGKFDEAEVFIQERVETRDKAFNAVPIFSHCHAIILFAKAAISGTEEDRKQAMDKLREVANMATEHIPKQGWAQSIAAWGMGYFTSSPGCSDVSEEELSCQIIEAESTFLSALLCFFEESMSSFFKGALLIRKAISGYRRCQGVLKQQTIGSKHEVGAIKLGFGGFSLVISMLPPKLLRLLSVLGFRCDRKAGLRDIEESLCSGGLRSSASGMLLLSYHVILPAFFSIPQEREQHIECAERVLATLHEMYPGSFFLSYYKGRLQRLKRDLPGSIEWFIKLEEGLRLTPNSKFFKMRHAWLYELGVSYMLELEWEAAEKYWAELEKDCVWSRAFFAYMHGVCLSMNGKDKHAADQFAKVPGLLRGKISGRVLAEEQYVSRKVKDHALDTLEGVKSIQARISGVEFLYLWNSFPQMPHDKLERVVQIIEEAETMLIGSTSRYTKDSIGRLQWMFEDSDEEDEIEMQDDYAVCSLIKGTAFRELGKLDAAHECLDNLREESCYVGAELFVFPMAAYERALLLINRHLNEVLAVTEQATNFDFLKQAQKELAIAEKFKQDYNFLWRLLGRIHAAHVAIRQLMSDEGSSNGKPSISYDDEYNEQWKDIEDEQLGNEKFDIDDFSLLST